MKRLSLTPRANWRELVEQAGMQYHTIDDATYWDEGACYQFNVHEIDILDAATSELNVLCQQAIEEVIRSDLFSRLRIPEAFVPFVISSWEKNDPSLYGRFDLAWDGSGPPKLLEYNADTPTALLEASVVQWFWLRDVFPRADQFNSIHEKLLSFWDEWPRHLPVHFACAAGSAEDYWNTEYLRDTAVQRGLTTERLFIEEIGWDTMYGKFVGANDEVIRTLFKLYPWEWMIREEFGRFLPKSTMYTLEPPWKMLLSNKGILPILWQMFPDHENLLPASFEDNPLDGDYIRKPLFSREGENIELHRAGGVVRTGGGYGSEGFIQQRYAPLPCFDGNYPVIGSWVINGYSAGIGIREDKSEITTNSSRFIPHFFLEV